VLMAQLGLMARLRGLVKLGGYGRRNGESNSDEGLSE
jgi:hypothetical protein